MSFRLCAAVFLVVVTLASAQAQEKYRVYLGTYTAKESKGIYQCELNLKDGSLSEATLAVETSSPSFLAFHPNRKFLYAVNEGQATISAFAIDDKTGNLTFLTRGRRRAGLRATLSLIRRVGTFSPPITVVEAASASPSKPMASSATDPRSSSTRANERTDIRSTSTRPTSSPSAATWA